MSANARVFTLTSDGGLVVRLTNYGGIIMSILAPDRDGRLADVVLGHDTVEAYRDNRFYLGAIIGRCANRIANAQFTLDGRTLSPERERRPPQPARRQEGVRPGVVERRGVRRRSATDASESRW